MTATNRTATNLLMRSPPVLLVTAATEWGRNQGRMVADRAGSAGSAGMASHGGDPPSVNASGDVMLAKEGAHQGGYACGVLDGRCVAGPGDGPHLFGVT